MLFYTVISSGHTRQTELSSSDSLVIIFKLLDLILMTLDFFLQSLYLFLVVIDLFLMVLPQGSELLPLLFPARKHATRCPAAPGHGSAHPWAAQCPGAVLGVCVWRGGGRRPGFGLAHGR